jgi:hypothetical protein
LARNSFGPRGDPAINLSRFDAEPGKYGALIFEKFGSLGFSRGPLEAVLEVRQLIGDADFRHGLCPLFFNGSG